MRDGHVLWGELRRKTMIRGRNGYQPEPSTPSDLKLQCAAMWNRPVNNSQLDCLHGGFYPGQFWRTCVKRTRKGLYADERNQGGEFGHLSVFIADGPLPVFDIEIINVVTVLSICSFGWPNL